MIKTISILLLILLLSACSPEITNVPIPEVQDSELDGSKNLTDFIRSNTEGIYYNGGQDQFGDSLVLKWNGDYLSVFCGKNTAYMVLEAGSKSNDIIFEGYWRHANSSETGIILLKILSGDGGKDLISGKVPDNIKISGTYAGPGGGNPKPIDITFVRKIIVHDPDFKIIAHKGGGRNIDRQPFPENSISLIEYCERLGANSIEIDVQLTKDKVPVLFHDEYLSKRTINEDYFIGRLSDYTFSQLRDFVTLRNLGDSKKEEVIPTLDEALSAVSKNTGLRTVWLDIKNPELISYIFPVLKKYYQKGKLDIYLGIPDEDVFNSIKQIPDYQSIPSLCELDESYVVDAGSLIWAPRWSLGLINDRVGEMHSQGKDVFVWTLDDPVLIKTYFHDGNFDGIVTNFSPVVAYEYYMGK